MTKNIPQLGATHLRSAVLLLLASFTHTYDRVFNVARPPRWLQRVALSAPLASLARARKRLVHEPRYRIPLADDPAMSEDVRRARPLSAGEPSP